MAKMDKNFPWDDWVCKTCVYWKRAHGRQREESYGTCRKNVPVKNEMWCRTDDTDGCGGYFSRQAWWDKTQKEEEERIMAEAKLVPHEDEKATEPADG